MPKRTATTQLNRDNWDVEEEPEEIGVFKKASKEAMSERVIRIGKRRSTQQPTNGTNIFAGFSGFSVPSSTSENPFKNLFSNMSNNSKNDKKESTSENDMKSNENEKSKINLPKVTFTSDKSFSSQFKNGNNELLKEGSKEAPKPDKQAVYLSKLKGLNETLLEWIKSHIEQNPTCILSPVFTDYDNYLKEIRTERDTRQKDASSSEDQKNLKSTFKFSKLPNSESLNKTSPQKKEQNEEEISANKDKPSTFTFGLSSGTNNPLLSSNSTSNFFIPPFEKKKPLTFQSENSGCETTEENKDGNEEEVAGEKYNLVPVIEEEALFSQRVKVFVKNDNNYADRGVGMLYIKNVSGKHQVVVRADTNLGNVLLNFILNKDIPSERMGKNNVTVVSIPTPDSKPAPIPILLRVKTEQEADKLLEAINKYKNTEVHNSD